jgi:adenine phosphoribosyltransferase
MTTTTTTFDVRIAKELLAFAKEQLDFAHYNYYWCPIFDRKRKLQYAQRDFENAQHDLKDALEMERLEGKIRTCPDFPIKGVQFKDAGELVADPWSFNCVLDRWKKRYIDKEISCIVGLESRGFIFGAALAAKLGIGFVPIRKKGKQPFKCHSIKYEKEYGTDEFELDMTLLSCNQDVKVIVIDDLLATGGSLCAAITLLKYANAVIVEATTLLEVEELNGREKILNTGIPFYCLMSKI